MKLLSGIFKGYTLFLAFAIVASLSACDSPFGMKLADNAPTPGATNGSDGGGKTAPGGGTNSGSGGPVSGSPITIVTKATPTPTPTPTPSPSPTNAGGGGGITIMSSPTPSPSPSASGNGFRTVTITPQNSAYITPIKLVFVIDNSPSMVNNQSDFAAGVSAMLEQVKGRNVTVYIYTTTNFSSVGPEFISEIGYNNPTVWGELWDTVAPRYETYSNYYGQTTGILDTKYELESPLGTWTTSPLQNGTPNPSMSPGASPHFRTTWNYRLEPALNGSVDTVSIPILYPFDEYSTTQSVTKPLIFSAGMDQASFDTLRLNVQSQLNTIPLTGSSAPSGMTTMGYVLTDTGPNQVFFPGDKGAFIVISDNDSSVQEAYVSGEDSYDIDSITVSYAGNPGYYWNTATVQTMDYNWSYTYPTIENETGTAVTITSTAYEGWGSFNPSSWPGTTTTGCSTMKACTQGMINALAAHVSVAPSAVTCSYGCSGNLGPFYAASSVTMNSSVEVNACTSSFVEGGITFASPDAYYEKYYKTGTGALGIANDYAIIPGSCTSSVQTYTGYPPSSSIVDYWNYNSSSNIVDLASIFNTIVNPAAAPRPTFTPVDLEPQMKTVLDKTLGVGGYFFSAIVGGGTSHSATPNPQCTPAATGTSYIKLATQLGNQGVTQSICDQDYSSALTPLQNFITTGVQNSYTLQLGATEHISKVQTQGATGAPITLTSSQVTIQGANLTFATGVLTNVQSIIVTIIPN
jgi:hypothetical protein